MSHLWVTSVTEWLCCFVKAQLLCTTERWWVPAHYVTHHVRSASCLSHKTFFVLNKRLGRLCLGISILASPTFSFYERTRECQRPWGFFFLISLPVERVRETRAPKLSQVQQEPGWNPGHTQRKEKRNSHFYSQRLCENHLSAGFLTLASIICS